MCGRTAGRTEEACMPLDLHTTHLPACMAGWMAVGAGRTGRTGRTLELDAQDGSSM